MKKQLTAIIMVLALFFAGAANVLAADQPDGMEKATKKSLQKEFYDYKNDTLELDKVQKFEVKGESGESITVYAALAKFQTVRDNIFTADHREAVYFNATEGKMMTATEVGELQNEELSAYKDQFEHLGKQVNLGWFLGLLALLLIVPGYFMFVWGNQVYSTTRFKVKNNLYNQHHTFN